MAKNRKKGTEENDMLAARNEQLEQEVKILRGLLQGELDAVSQTLPDTMPVLVGIVDQQFVSFPLSAVVEVLPRVFITPLPESLPYVIGAVQWRGEQIPVVDLSARCGNPPLPVRLEDRIVVVDYRDRRWGLLVSDIDRLDTIHKHQLTAIPPEIPSAPFAIGLWSFAENNVLLLSLPHLINPLELLEK